MKFHWGLVLLVPGFMGGMVSAQRSGVRPGIEMLLSDSAHLVRGKRVGLVTNRAGVDRAGRRGVDRLLAEGVTVVALFSPEHGLTGSAAPGAAVASGLDSVTGLPIYSLYGAASAPDTAILSGIDVLLVDLQDAGARYYTYLWTTVEVMRAAATRRIPVLLLDRPNPLGGTVQGNVLDTAYRSAVGLLAIPMRHGMTLGELALLARHDLGLTTQLTVIPAAGWHRAMYYDATGLPFVPPSPNLSRLEALQHYPGLCLFEGTALSVGRGTDHPFEQIGAPDLDGSALTARLGEVPGVRVTPVHFTPHQPGDLKFSDTTVSGVRLAVVDRGRYDPILTALRLLAAVERTSPGTVLRPGTQLARLFGADPEVLSRLTDDRIDSLAGAWRQQQAGFLQRRRPYLLYPK
jgi:uncharacterized protein YbbC (DUF1343 family)